MKTLQLTEETTVDDVIEFAIDRIEEPAILRDGEVLVYSFNNHDFDVDALGEFASDAPPGIYVVPYQVPAVWANIWFVLPHELRRADPLVYRRSEERYVAYENYVTNLTEYDVGSLREGLRDRLWGNLEADDGAT